MKTEKLKEEIKEQEELVSEEEWGTFEEFFRKEYENKHKDMYAFGMALILHEKEVNKAELKGGQEATQDFLKLIDEEIIEEGKAIEEKRERDWNILKELKFIKLRLKEKNARM